ncbi:hypothetical protein [Streptomyces fagopyri]|uniref:hypothetical protein n=1 Tax=Streptomyces fagopyri TaxID=2662397 RepID=UPI00382550E4
MMAALPTTIRLGCPLCGDPIDLPMKAGPTTLQGERLVISLSADDAPLRTHLTEQHAINKAGKPSRTEAIALEGKPQTWASVSFNVRPATPSADGTAALQEAARHARTQPLGRR